MLPHGPICFGCRRRRHYHPRACPSCAAVRPLGYHDRHGQIVCADCAGQPSIFACHECGSEAHPYGGTRCARCFLKHRLTALLTDPATATINGRLRPVFDNLMASERPQTALYWLRRPPGHGPRLLGQMACGQIPISHDTFAGLPADRAHNYLRDLLTAVGVLPAYDPEVARLQPWLAAKVAGLPAEQATIIRRFARWNVLRRLQQATKPVTRSTAGQGRMQINAAIRLLAWTTAHDTDIAALTQPQLESYLTQHPPARTMQYRFITWLNTSGINTQITMTAVSAAPPAITMSDQMRWQHVAVLLHDDSIATHVRIAGLFMLLFAQPLSRICHITTDQITIDDDGVWVCFGTTPIQMPTPLDDLIADHLTSRGHASYVARDNGWLFPGGIPGRPLSTESIRGPLVARGIRPFGSRKAALFGLAAQIPTPVLADLLGIATTTATRWAALAARDWTGYIAQRHDHQDQGHVDPATTR